MQRPSTSSTVLVPLVALALLLVNLAVLTIYVQDTDELMAKSANGSTPTTNSRLAALVWVVSGVSALTLVAMVLRLRRGAQPLGEQATAPGSHTTSNVYPSDQKVHARAAELTELSRHLIRVAEEEKAQLARELHDTFGSNLTAINMDLNWIAKRLPQERPELSERLQRALGMLSVTVRSTQDVIDRLRPSELDNLGLAVALQSHCRELAQRVGWSCEVDSPEDFRSLDQLRSITLYRVAQEALANVEKHAQAHAIKVQLRREATGIRLVIWDNGVGLPDDLTKVSHGLVGMRERIEALGGTLNVSSAREKGTQVDAFVPVETV